MTKATDNSNDRSPNVRATFKDKERERGREREPEQTGSKDRFRHEQMDLDDPSRSASYRKRDRNQDFVSSRSREPSPRRRKTSTSSNAPASERERERKRDRERDHEDRERKREPEERRKDRGRERTPEREYSSRREPTASTKFAPKAPTHASAPIRNYGTVPPELLSPYVTKGPTRADGFIYNELADILSVIILVPISSSVRIDDIQKLLLANSQIAPICVKFTTQKASGTMRMATNCFAGYLHSDDASAVAARLDGYHYMGSALSVQMSRSRPGFVYCCSCEQSRSRQHVFPLRDAGPRHWKWLHVDREFKDDWNAGRVRLPIHRIAPVQSPRLASGQWREQPHSFSASPSLTTRETSSNRGLDEVVPLSPYWDSVSALRIQPAGACDR